MKILWQVSFRPLNKSKSNDNTQSRFIDSIKNLAQILLSVSRFLLVS